MERTWSNDSGAASSASSGIEETTSLATTIPGSTSRLLINTVVESPLESARPVSASTARRRYSWNVAEEEQITPKGTRQRIPALDLDTSSRNRNTQPRLSPGARVDNEPGLFSDVVLSPIEIKQFPHGESRRLKPHDAVRRNSQQKTDRKRTLDQLGASNSSASDSRQTDSEGEHHELEHLPLQSRYHNGTGFSTFESSSNPAWRRKSQSRRIRYPPLRTTGLEIQDNAATPSRRPSLQERVGDLVRQISSRVVNINAEEEEEERMPFNAIQEGDVQSESDSDLGGGEDTSELAYMDSNANRNITEPSHDSKPMQQPNQGPQINQPPINSTGLVQELPREQAVPQVLSNEGKTLGLFGPNSHIRKASNTLIRNRYVLLYYTYAKI